jgi:hypothetical protein
VGGKGGGDKLTKPFIKILIKKKKQKKKKKKKKKDSRALNVVDPP